MKPYTHVHIHNSSLHAIHSRENMRRKLVRWTWTRLRKSNDHIAWFAEKTGEAMSHQGVSSSTQVASQNLFESSKIRAWVEKSSKLWKKKRKQLGLRMLTSWCRIMRTFKLLKEIIYIQFVSQSSFEQDTRLAISEMGLAQNKHSTRSMLFDCNTSSISKLLLRALSQRILSFERHSKSLIVVLRAVNQLVLFPIFKLNTNSVTPAYGQIRRIIYTIFKRKGTRKHQSPIMLCSTSQLYWDRYLIGSYQNWQSYLGHIFELRELKHQEQWLGHFIASSSSTNAGIPVCTCTTRCNAHWYMDYSWNQHNSNLNFAQWSTKVFSFLSHLRLRKS